MKVLLVQPPNFHGDKDREAQRFPLGLAYVAAVLKEKGHEVEIFDAWVNHYSKEETLSKLKDIEYDIMGITAMSPHFKYMEWFIKEVKGMHPERKILIGGALAKYNYKQVLETMDVDFCVLGWGEYVMPKLLENLEDPSEVESMAYLKDGKVFVTKSISEIHKIDEVPFPAWDLFDVEKYIGATRLGIANSSRRMCVITTRGCPFNCHFCSKNFPVVNMRSVDNVIEEIKILKDKYKVEVIDFEDELVMMSRKRMLELCEKIKPLKIRWKCNGRVNHVDFEVLKAMKASGCYYVAYGIESGSQTILDSINKESTVELNERALRLTVKAGLIPGVLMMIGNPKETRETVRETINFCKRLHVQPVTQFFISTPLPGSEFYRMCVEDGRITDEVEYLRNLTGPYEILINLSDMSDDELLVVKREAEEEINKAYCAYRRTNPKLFLKEYTHKAKVLYHHAKGYGIKKAAKDVIKIIKKNPRLIFRAEYTE